MTGTSPTTTELLANIEMLRSSIEKIDKVKVWLNDNTNETKSKIQTVMSRQLETLRTREVWLLGQVDLLQATKRSALDQQLKALWDCLGHLQACLLHMEKKQKSSEQEEEDLQNMLINCLKRFNDLELSPTDTPYISFQAEVDKLRDIICRFGKVHSKAFPLEMAFAPTNDSSHAQSLPQMIEDYGDEQHHIMYKTVQEAVTKPGDAVMVSFHAPSLAVRKCHQRSRANVDLVQPAGCASVPVVPEWHRWLMVQQQRRRLAAQTPHIRQWLRELHQEASLEEEEEVAGLFSSVQKHYGKPVDVERETSDATKMLDFAHFQKILTSPSMMWLKQADAARNADESSPSESYQAWLSYFKTVNSDVRNWLLAAGTKQEDGCCGGECSSPLMKRMMMDQLDIESLQDLACMKLEDKQSCGFDKDVWLSKEAQSLEKVRLEKMCKANEKCGSFDECLCDEKCCGRTCEAYAPLPQPLKNHDNRSWLLDEEASTVAASGYDEPLFDYFESVQGSKRLAWLFEPAVARGTHDNVTAGNMGGSQTLVQALGLSNGDNPDLRQWLQSSEPSCMDDDASETMSEVTSCSEPLMQIPGSSKPDLHQWLRSTEPALMDGDAMETMSDVTSFSESTYTLSTKQVCDTPADNYNTEMFNDVANWHKSSSSDWLAGFAPRDLSNDDDVMKKWLRFSSEKSKSEDTLNTGKRWLMGDNGNPYHPFQVIDPDRDRVAGDKAQELPECLDDIWLSKSSQTSQRTRTTSELSFEVLSEKEALYLAERNPSAVAEWLAKSCGQ